MCFVEITNPLKLNELKGVYGAQNRTNILTFYYIEIPFILH